MSKRLKTGLIGAGVFAGYHANKLSEHPDIDFTGVYDPDVVRATALSDKHHIRSLSASQLFSASDAVIIACPASFHGRVALQALDAGCHCLVEKPMAVSREDAERIVVLSAEKGLVVQIGHQERLVFKAIGLDRVTERPVAVDAIRNSSYSERGTDTSVTMDLMTHDIDLCTLLFGQAPDHVDGRSEAVHSQTPDVAEAVLTYGAAIARLRASRVAELGQRRMVLTYPSGRVEIDFNAKTLINDTPFDLNADFGSSDLARDSLGAATTAFVAAILQNQPVPVSAEDGLIAVSAALQIDGEAT